MSVREFVSNASPPVDDSVDGDGWHAALCLAWAQIIEGSTECAACGEPARVVLATGADPEYASLCWKHAASMIFASLDMGARFWGETE